MPDIVAVDTAYSAYKAVTAGVLIHTWDSVLPEDAFISETATASEYISGEFYKRELPCILNFLKEVPWEPEIIIIDGYVLLGEHTMGMGLHLYEALGKTIPVIGVAKRPFAGNTTALPIFRGSSKRPLHITAAGISLREAALDIKNMYGSHRIPVILKAADILSKNPGLLSAYTKR